VLCNVKWRGAARCGEGPVSNGEGWEEKICVEQSGLLSGWSGSRRTLGWMCE
jgi:hypothetical protein